MRRVIALALVVSLTLLFTAPAAEAGHAPVVVGVGAALGLVLAAPFILAGAIVAPLVHPWWPVYPYAAPYPLHYGSPYAAPYASVAEPVVARPPVYAPQAYAVTPAPRVQAVALQSPAAAQATTVQYPHGRYELRGDGVYTAYRWVWIPKIPPPPPPPDAPLTTSSPARATASD